jgi:ABC-type transporter Mla maintaining outer membrane lipid asymmetry ATPase subunit MlaF
VASEFAETLPNGEVVFKSEDNKLCLVNTRFLMLKEGSIIFEGSDEALRSSDDSYIQEFLE